MKRRILGLLFSICLVFSLTIPVSADSSVYVLDQAGILSMEEQTDLTEQARTVSEAYACGVHIAIVPDYMVYGSSVEAAAEQIYHQYSMGYGPNQDGMVLLLSMADRDYDLCAYGTGNTAFTDYGKEQLAQTFLDDFGDDDWYAGFTDYISTSGEYLQMAADGTPFDVDTDPNNDMGPLTKFIIVIGVPALIAGLICLFLKRGMRSVYKAASAQEYTTPDSLKLTVNTDRYTRTTTTRTKIERESSSSSGGTSVNSSGHSHSSGKF